MEYINLLSQASCLGDEKINDAVQSTEFPWSFRVKQIELNIEKFHPNIEMSEALLKTRHSIRDSSVLCFNKQFMDRSIKSFHLQANAGFFLASQPAVVLGVHDYSQVLTAYIVNQIKPGLFVFAEDVQLVAQNLRSVFARGYGEFSNPEIGGVVVQTGGAGKSPYDAMEKSILGGKSVYATIDVFADVFKSVASVKGRAGNYSLVVGLIRYYLEHNYRFYFSRSIISSPTDIQLFIEPLSGGDLSEIAQSYIERLEYYNDVDPMGWEGYACGKAIG